MKKIKPGDLLRAQGAFNLRYADGASLTLSDDRMHHFETCLILAIKVLDDPTHNDALVLTQNGKLGRAFTDLFVKV